MKYYYGMSYKEALSNNPVEISNTKILEQYKDVYSVVVPVEKMVVSVMDIDYDIDEDEIEQSGQPSLPAQLRLVVEIDDPNDIDEVEEVIADAISNATGYCINNFVYEILDN